MMFSQSAPPASSPEPRLRARSMLSLGTEAFLAFLIMSSRVGLAAGSPPPVRAATSMFLTIFANSLPRLASFAAFLCFVVAHFEWPAIKLPFVRKKLACHQLYVLLQLSILSPAHRARENAAANKKKHAS